jgi:flavin reductase
MDHPFERWIDPALFRRVMGRFATGVTLIAARWPDGAVRAMTASAFMSGSLDPPLCVISVGKTAHMHACLVEADGFSVNFLGRGQEALSNHFAGRRVAGLEVRFGDIQGIPILPDAVAHVVSRKEAVHDCGDHSLFIGAILAMDSRDGEPLLYHAGRYGSFREGGPEEDAEAPPVW